MTGKYVLVNVFNGDGGEHAFWIRENGGAFRRLSRFEDMVVDAKFGDDALYVFSRAHAPNGKLLRLALPGGRSRRRRRSCRVEGRDLELPAGRGPALRRGHRRRTVRDARLHRARQAGGHGGAAAHLLGRRTRARRGNAALVRTESYTTPGRWWRYDPKAAKLAPTPLVQQSPATFADVEVTRVFATSKDGTKVPINLLYRKGTKLDGSAPTLLYGYGGYGISETPSFSPTRQVWIEQGGIYAAAGIRGGGEYGDAWHRAGNLTKKQNVFDDFAACAQYLVDHKYTNRSKLAMRGGSNGGLLMGAMITQHPELMKSVVCSVGLLDAVRSEFEPNGEFNITEFGTIKDPEQFKALYAYSPYTTSSRDEVPGGPLHDGANDPRVAPQNSRKMAARMQAANASDEPVLLRTSATTGHGIGSPLSAKNEEAADWYSFLFKTLEVPYQPVATPLP
jgi:prolyl oligopeptidase